MKKKIVLSVADVLIGFGSALTCFGSFGSAMNIKTTLELKMFSSGFLAGTVAALLAVIIGGVCYYIEKTLGEGGDA